VSLQGGLLTQCSISGKDLIFKKPLDIQKYKTISNPKLLEILHPRNQTKMIPWDVQNCANLAFLSKNICQLLANLWQEKLPRSPLKTQHEYITLCHKYWIK
jgi:hypothetical protein